MSFSAVSFAFMMAKMSTSCLTSFRRSSVFLFCDSPPAFHWRIFRSMCVLWEGLCVGSLVCSEKGIFVLFPSDCTYLLV